MKPAGYRDIQAEEIPTASFPGGNVKVIAGKFGSTNGPVQGGSTDPVYWDVTLQPNEVFTQEIKDKAVYLYPFEGSVEIEDRPLKTHQGGVLGAGDTVRVKAGAEGAIPYLRRSRSRNRWCSTALRDEHARGDRPSHSATTSPASHLKVAAWMDVLKGHQRDLAAA
jgi:hypothetical protein